MKRALGTILGMMQQTDPAAAVSVALWDGQVISIGKAPRVILHLRCPGAAKRILGDGFLGLGEAYMAGAADIEGDLQELLRLGFAIEFDHQRLSLPAKLRLGAFKLLNRNTCFRAQRNIARHYNLGEEFYRLYLDDSLTYSSAYFKNADETLEQAQINKYEHIARKLCLMPGESLLDIGCGWGGMLIHAARTRGVHGLGISLSHPQCASAGRRIQDQGLAGRIEVAHRDYRDVSGSFDKLVSIGMFEHVGRAYIPRFMEQVAKLLKPGGLGLLHTIGKDAPSPTDPWLLQYIFPGGYLPALAEIVQAMGQRGLMVLDVENLRLHYARTLDLWAQRFERNAEKVRQMFGEAFVRRWRLFLQGSAAGFKYGRTRLYQILFCNGINNALPLTRQHVYEDKPPLQVGPPTAGPACGTRRSGSCSIFNPQDAKEQNHDRNP